MLVCDEPLLSFPRCSFEVLVLIHFFLGIGNAKLAGFDKDLGLVGYDYNAVLSIFFVAYIIFEIPSNLMCKWIGPGWWLPAITLGFGICSVATAFVHDMSTASGVRFLLGYVS